MIGMIGIKGLECVTPLSFNRVCSIPAPDDRSDPIGVKYEGEVGTLRCTPPYRA